MELSVPTTAALHHSQSIPTSNPSIRKLLGRLTRSSLISLALDWLDDRNQENSFPYLSQEEDEDEQDLYPPAASFSELREIYTELQSTRGSKHDVLDRIVEGDWRDGLTLYQLAMADMQYLYDHPLSQKWSASKIVRLASGEDTKQSTSIPRFVPSIFVQNLQKEVLPDVKAHYNFVRHPSLPLFLLRIYILDSPYNTSLALSSKTTTFSSSKTFYIAFPDASPYIYVSLIPSVGNSSILDTKSLRKLTLDGIAKAFSKPRERYKLESTGFTTKNLEALVEKRGGGRTNAAGGGWGIYAEENKEDNPLNPLLPTEPLSTLSEVNIDAAQDLVDKELSKVKGMKRRRDPEEESVAKKRQALARSRFGNSAKPDDGKGIERFDVRIEDTFPSFSSVSGIQAQESDAEPGERSRKLKSKGRRSTITEELDRIDEDDDVEEGGVEEETWKPDIRVTFHGHHVFAGVRELVELGVIDGRKMPGWMTGEDGVTVGVVRSGRIKARGL